MRVRELAQSVFKKKLPKGLTIRISSRMTRKLGVYRYLIITRPKKRIHPLEIVFAHRLVCTEDFTDSFIEDVILHELCHWYASHVEKRECGHDSKFRFYAKKFGLNLIYSTSDANEYLRDVENKAVSLTSAE